MSDVEASGSSDSEETETPEASSGMDDGLDEEDLRSIEDELFDLEDELIEMQGTTIRTFEENAQKQDLKQVFTYRKSDEDDESAEESDSEGESFLERLEDFKESMQVMREVKPGQLLAADLRGSTPQFEGGYYTITNPEADRVFAGRVGQVSWSGDTVHVLPVKRIEGDLDAEERDVRYDGSVFVEGDVHNNKTIEATGNIWVLGGVGRSDLKASGSIVVGQGIKGSEEHKVESYGNVYAEFIENAQVSAGGSVFVEEVVMHSEVTAGESICLVGEKGFLVGGTARATRMLYANEIGSKNFPETHIKIGSSGTLQEGLEEAREKKEQLEEEESEYLGDVKNLLNKKQEEGSLSPDDEERLRKFQFELNHIRQDLQETKDKIEDLKEELDTDREQRIDVDGSIFPGVELEISDASEEINDEQSHTTITLHEGEFRFDSFSEPDLDLDLTTDIDPDNLDLEEKFDVPPLDQLRRHIVYAEKEPLFDRERQLKRFMDVPKNHDLVLMDVTQDSDQIEEEPAQDDEEDAEESSTPQKVWWGIEVREGEKKQDVRRHYDSKRKDAVRVRCETPEEGVRRAADYFGVEPDELAVKIIEEGSSGVFGFGQSDYLIRAVLRRSLQEEDSSDIEENDLMEQAEEQEGVAGFINIDNTEDGLKLAVYPPEGHGLPVTVEQVEDELQETRFTTDVDWAKVEEVVESAEGEKVVIGPRQRDPEIDGSYSIHLNEIESEAYLTVYPPQPEGIPVEKEEVIEHLEDDGMDYDRTAVEEVFEEERYEEDVLIASGSEPVDGEDGEVEFKVDLPREDLAELLDQELDEVELEKEDPDPEAVDHRIGEHIISVRENEVLAEIKPATEGEPGITVYGDEIPCEHGEPIDIPAGENVRKSGDQKKLLSEEEGRVLVKNGRLTVEPVFIVEGDLDYETGNVEFDGVVLVKGQILDGFRVEAGGRVEAESAGKCKIVSDGDVYLKKGMNGKEEGLIRAKGCVQAKYFENTQVIAQGSVHVEQTIMHSYVDAGENLILGRGKKGAIIGGQARAGKAISTKKLGSSMAPNTEVEVGIRPKVRDRVAELEDEIENQKSKFEKVRLGLQGLNDKIEEVGGKDQLSEEKQDKHSRLSNVASAIKHKLEALHGELEDLRNEIQSSQGGEVYVYEDVFPGTKITIQTHTLHITDNDNHIRCILENGEIMRVDYEDPEIDFEFPNTIL